MDGVEQYFDEADRVVANLEGVIAGGGTPSRSAWGNFVFSRFDGASNDSAILDVTVSAEGVRSLD